MKHLRKYNESSEKTFKNDDDDIKYFFTDYTDDNPSALTIKNGLIYDGRFVEDTAYMKDPSKWRRAKLITLRVGKPTGINLGMSSCMTDLKMLSNALLDIERFYDLSGEDVNYAINNDYMGLSVQFITLGDMVNSDESQSTKIDDYLKRIGECIKKKGHKKQTIKGNWLDMRVSKTYQYGLNDKLRKIGSGELELNMTSDTIDKEIITVRNEAWEDGLKFNLSGGDGQVVLKLVKR